MSYMVRVNLDDRVRSLERLAYLLRNRFAPASGRSFVMLFADLRRGTTDNIATQPMPVLKVPEQPLSF